MTTLHKASLPVLGLLAAFALAGCSLLTPATPTVTNAPETPAAPTVSVTDFNDTDWAGTDSEGTDTTFTFHEGGSTAVSFSGNPYDDPGDTWAINGETLTITIYNVENVGDATYTGTVTNAAGPIDLALSFSDVSETRTLTITKG
ncbi:hypothetical protein BH09ACT4_BH09ACT4_06260 [soil metagenome]